MFNIQSYQIESEVSPSKIIISYAVIKFITLRCSELLVKCDVRYYFINVIKLLTSLPKKSSMFIYAIDLDVFKRWHANYYIKNKLHLPASKSVSAAIIIRVTLFL